MAYDPTGKTLAELVADQNRAKTDPIFLGQVLGYDFVEDVHRELFDQMPLAVPGKPLADWSTTKNVLILWPRGHFKTSAVVVRIVQNILNMPDVRIMLMSANLKLTQGWLREIKSHFNGKNPKSGLLALFGPKWLVEKSNASAFTVPTRQRMHLKEPTCWVASAKAVQTGTHCDLFFGDDLVNTANYRNVELQDKLEEDFSGFVPLLDPGGYTCVTGTRYSGADVYGRFSQKPNYWKVSLKKARIGQQILFPQRAVDAGARKIGFTHEILDAIQKDDPVMYAAQYLNEIHVAGRQIFPQELVLGAVRSTKHDGYPKDHTCYFAMDLAESKRAEADHSVIAIGRRDRNGSTWVEDVVGSNWTPSQAATVLLNLNQKYRPAVVFIQKAAGAETFAELVRVMAEQHGIAIRMELVKMSNQRDAKYIRIAALESEFKNKRLFLCASIRDFARLEEEFTQFPKGRHDDRPDAISTLASQLNLAAPLHPRLRFMPPGGFAGVPGEDPDYRFDAGENMMGDGFVC